MVITQLEGWNEGYRCCFLLLCWSSFQGLPQLNLPIYWRDRCKHQTAYNLQRYKWVPQRWCVFHFQDKLDVCVNVYHSFLLVVSTINHICLLILVVCVCMFFFLCFLLTWSTTNVTNLNIFTILYGVYFHDVALHKLLFLIAWCM